jgi:hypothetical protein
MIIAPRNSNNQTRGGEADTVTYDYTHGIDQRLELEVKNNETLKAYKKIEKGSQDHWWICSGTEPQ